MTTDISRQGAPRILLTTGGTGGHVFPALAVAEEIKRLYPAAEILFMGGQYGKEAIWVNKAGVEFVGLPVRGMIGRGIKAVAAAGSMICAVFQAVKIIRDFRPDVVAGFGGYAAFAGVLGGAFCRRPVLIHEHNAVPGVSNKIVGKVADRVCIFMPESAGHFPEHKVVATGNPVRAKIMFSGAGRTYVGSTRRLLVVGGSQGARAVNEAVLKALPALKAAGVEIWHQTGEMDFEMVKAGYAAAEFSPEQARVEPFISDMGEAYAWADLGLMRSGASSVAELAAAGLPALLVPFPFATHDHQTHNARFLSEAGAAVLIEQKSIGNLDLGARIVALLNDSENLRKMSAACAALGEPNAAGRVLEVMREISPGEHWNIGISDAG